MPKLNSSFFITLFLLCLFSNLAFSSTSTESLDTTLVTSRLQDSLSHSEKVYLHFDKPYYATGEIMWFKAYLVSANTNRPNAKSTIVHVDLIDEKNNILNSRSIKIANGGGEGEFYLPKRLNPGTYKVRAYTNFMRNFDASYFFVKGIRIKDVKSLVKDSSTVAKTNEKKKQKNSLSPSKPDLQFFPEGGYMVVNQTSEIGFKVIGKDGKSVAVIGSILDANNKEILTFRTQKFGLGSFQFTPKRKESYKASINYNGRTFIYNLPEALKKGVTMKVVERKDNYQIRLQSSLPNGVDQLVLAGIQNGTIVNVAELIGSKKIGTINVPKKTLKQGIGQFMISDKNQKPLCERLVFIQTDEPKPTPTLTSDKPSYKKRELVTLNLDLDTIDLANLSLAVTDLSVVNKDRFSLDIRSHLLLNSELKGEIEQPGYYFDLKNNDRKELLDLLMLTQGWRQFLWNHIDERTDKQEFDHETGIRLIGTVQDQYKQRNIASAELSLIYNNKDQMVEATTRSLKDGKFSFGDYQFNDSTNVLIQVKSRNPKRNKKSNADYFIKLGKHIPPPVNFKNNFLPKFKKQKSYESTPDFLNRDYMVRSRVSQLNSVTSFEEDYEQLDEANVNAIRKRGKEKFNNRNNIYNDPSFRADFDELPYVGGSNVLAAIQGKVPGIRIRGNVDNPISFVNGDGETVRNYDIRVTGGAITMSGGTIPPLILLDNFEVQDISSIYAYDISHVDILTPARAAIFGSRAAGGVLSIHSKRGSDNFTKTERKYGMGVLNFIHPGYYKARKFYTPNYAIKKPSHSKFDYRTTIHWEPTISYRKNQKVIVSFYTADIDTKYRIDLQGISKNGIPIKKELFIDVE